MWRFVLFLLGVAVIGAAGLGAALVRDDDPNADAPVRAAVVGAPDATEDRPAASRPDRDPAGEGEDAAGDVEPHLSAAAVPVELEPYLPPAEQRDAYRRAVLARDGGRWAEAAERFEAAAAPGGVLGAVAHLRAAQMFALAAANAAEAEADSDGDAAAADSVALWGAALEAFERALADPDLPGTLVVIAHREAADAAGELDRPREAAAQLGAVIGSSSSSSWQVADALWARAALRREAGEPWVEDAQLAVRTQPGSVAATAALDALETAGVAVAPQDAAYARYRAWQNEEAEEQYRSIAAAPLTAEDAARAWFFLGALAERRFDNDDAIDAYRRSLDWDATGPLADDARWWLGLLFEDEDAPLQAAGQFRVLVEEFPDSPFAAGASVRAGVALAVAGETAEAEQQLRDTMATAAPHEAAEAARWLQAFGYATPDDPAPATFDPTSIAALFDGGDARAPLPAAALDEWTTPTDGVTEADRAAADAWMRQTFGERPAGSGSGRGALADPGLAAALALSVAGEDQVARGLLAAVIRRYDGQPYELLDLARIAERAALHDMALSAAVRLLSGLTPQQRLGVPLAVERYAYPLAYAEPLEAAARAEGVPPLLLAALVRQESAYNRYAGSVAGASGLTQVIDPTGRQIAAALDEPWPADLFDPERSLRYGAYYLAEQLEDFDGDVLAALAAYNGGPGNAARWQEIQELPGADGYLHAVEFTETREYLRRVLEHYAWYRYLYAGAPAPAIR